MQDGSIFDSYQKFPIFLSLIAARLQRAQLHKNWSTNISAAYNFYIFLWYRNLQEVNPKMFKISSMHVNV